MHASKKTRAGALIVRCAAHALCVVLGAGLLAACSKSTIDPARYGQSNGQPYAQSGTAVQGYGQPAPGGVQETTLSESPAASAAAPASGSAVGAPGAVPIVGEGTPAPAASGYTTSATPGATAPATTYATPAYTPPAVPAPSAPLDGGPVAPSAEEELAAMRAASQAPYAPAASTPQAPQASGTSHAVATASGSGAGGVVYQLQAFLDRSRAQSYRDQLAAKGHDVFFEEAMVNGQQYTRVLVRLQGSEQERRAVLTGLGAPNARPRRDASPAAPVPVAPAPAAPGQSAYTPAATVQAASLPVAQPAPQAVPLAKPAPVPAALPVVTPPSQPAAAPAPVHSSSSSPNCQVTPTHIQATGMGLPGAGSPLMIEKQAREDATRNLMLCVDSYRKERGQVPQNYTMQATIPVGLLQVGDVELLGDGSVRATMRIRITDLPQLDVQVLD